MMLKVSSLMPWESTLVCNFRTVGLKRGQSTLPVTALSHDTEEEQGTLHSGGENKHISQEKGSLFSQETYEKFKTSFNFESTDSELSSIGMTNAEHGARGHEIREHSQEMAAQISPYLCDPITPLLLSLCLLKRIVSTSCLHNTGAYNVHVFIDTTWKLIVCCNSSLI